MNLVRLAQHFVLETFARAEAIKGQCEHLLTFEYASDAPKNLAKCLVSINSFFQDVARNIYNDIEDSLLDIPEDKLETTLSILKHLDQMIIHIGEHVQYIDSARSQRVPWSIIPAFEDFAEELLGEVEVMFCPLWEYNYQIITNDLKEYYLHILETFYTVPGIDKDRIDDSLVSLKKPFHIIRFPSTERLNIRLHANLGHELGHKFASQFLTKENKEKFTSTVIEEIKQHLEKKVKEGKIPKEPLLKLNFLQNFIDIAVKIWERALSEIISDITACIIFGPAALFSMYDFALQDRLDHLPNERLNYYPSWRYRLRIAIKVLERYEENFFPLPKTHSSLLSETFERDKHVAEYYSHIKKLTENTTDINIIHKDYLVEIVYNKLGNWIEKGIDFLTEIPSIKNKQLSPKKLYEKLPYLIERLDHKIIPNALEVNVAERYPADCAEIINTAWYFWLSKPREIIKNGDFNKETYIDRINMNKLSLKAVEYAHLEQRYKKDCKI